MVEVIAAPTPPQSFPAPGTLTGSQILLMSVLCALSAGSLYYSQVMVDASARSFGVASSSTAWLSGLSHAGYVLGLIFLVPLGDRFEKRSVIAALGISSGCALLLAALAPTFQLALLAAALIGVFATTASLSLPMAAALSEPERRGRVIGQLMLGLLSGIVFSRLLAGIVTEALGWRAMYLLASACQFLIIILMIRLLPLAGATTRDPYLKLLSSLLSLYGSEPELRTAAWRGAMLFAAFSAFWATFSLHIMAGTPGWGAITPGLFGIAGAVGALIAPFAGRLADKRGPHSTFTYALYCSLLGLALLFAFKNNVIGQAIGIVILDVGVQMAMVSNQTIIYGLQPAARTRINSVYMIIYFAGGALGASTALFMWHQSGWTGVLTACYCFALAGGLVHWMGTRRRQHLAARAP
jgi:predicted MFS family arabinose efflux permease